MYLRESAEMYLETIYLLSLKNGSVRSIDVAEDMGFSKPSVSRAVGLLKQDGYLTMAEDGQLTLTEKGTDIAKRIFERHTVLSQFLSLIGVQDEIAAKDACRIEHVVSNETIDAIKRFISK